MFSSSSCCVQKAYVGKFIEFPFITSSGLCMLSVFSFVFATTKLNIFHIVLLFCFISLCFVHLNVTVYSYYWFALMRGMLNKTTFTFFSLNVSFSVCWKNVLVSFSECVVSLSMISTLFCVSLVRVRVRSLIIVFQCLFFFVLL